MRRDGIRRSQTLYKFIVYQTKGLVSNNRGKPSYSDSFDHVIYDLYGVKHFSRKIADYYDDRDIIDLIERVGLDQLIRLMKNTRYCSIVRQLTLIDNDTESLEKEIRKMRRKGKSNKHMLREFNDLKKLYDKGVKLLRRRLGIRNAKTAYKRRYMAVRNFVSGGRDFDDDYGFNGLSNFHHRGYGYDPYDDGRSYDYDYYDDDPYAENNDDYDDEYDEDSSELEDFERMLNGPRTKKMSVYHHPESDDYYDDDPYASNDDIDKEEYENYHRKRSYIDSRYDENDRLDELTSHVIELSDCVQALMSQNRYDQVHHRDLITHYPIKKYAQEYIPPQTQSMNLSGSEEKIMETILGEIDSLKEATNHIVDGMLRFQRWQDEINDIIAEEAIEEGEFGDESEVVMGAPVVDDKENYYQKLANMHPDVYTTEMEDLPEEKVPPMPPKPKDPDHMTHEEVIDQVNRSQAQKVNWSGKRTKEPQTTAREPKPVHNKEKDAPQNSEVNQKTDENK